MPDALKSADPRFARLKQDGVVIEDTPGGCIRLSTTDAKIAEKYEMVD